LVNVSEAPSVNESKLRLLTIQRLDAAIFKAKHSRP